MATVDLTGLDRIVARLRRVEDLDYSPLMIEWEKLIVEDNRAKVLSGQNKDGTPVEPPLKYRNGIATPTKLRGRRKFGLTTADFKGFSLVTHLPHNNLTTAEYKKLTGPFSAPRREESRVIANLVTQHGFDGAVWFAEGAWQDVLSAQGTPLFRYLFAPPGRDMRGVRPEGRQKARRLLVEFARAVLAHA